MKKIMVLLAVLLLVLSACSKEAAPDKTTAPSQSAPASASTPAKPASNQSNALPADTYKISASDLSNPITLKYKIDDEDIGIVKSATFDIRNFGKDPIKPVIIFYVGGESDSSVKRFEYDELPAGYKMIKTEVVNMKVSSLHEPNAIKAELGDVLQGDKKIGEDSKTYIAKPSYD